MDTIPSLCYGYKPIAMDTAFAMDMNPSHLALPLALGLLNGSTDSAVLYSHDLTGPPK